MMVSSDQLVVISPHNVTRLFHLVEKLSKHHFLLDPDKAAKVAQLKSVCGTLLKKFGQQSAAGVQLETPKPKAAGRSSGPPLSSLRRISLSKEMRDKIKCGTVMQRRCSSY